MKNRSSGAKKILSILLILATLLSLAACGDGKGKDSAKENGDITDSNGREIELTDDPSSATAASVYAVSTPFFVALKITDRVLAINVKKPFWKSADEGLGKAGTVGNGVVDLEKLAKYHPSALVHRSNDPETVRAVENLGIDVICITVENMDDVKATLRMLGRYYGAEEAAETAAEWIDKKYAYIDSIVEKIPEEKRVTALLMGGELGRVAGKDMLQSWMIEKAGGIPVVTEAKDHNWINIGVERIFEYDPQVLFCTSSTAREYTTEELLSDKAWSAMKAVTSGNIYVMPCKQDSWDMPGLSPVLGTMYMLHCMYPEYFSEEDLFDQMDQYYRFMFGRTFTLEELGYQ